MILRTRVVLLAFALVAILLPASPAAAEEVPSVRLSVNKPIHSFGQTIQLIATIRAMNLTYVLELRYPGETSWRQIGYAGNVNDDVIETSLGAFYNAQVRASLIDAEGTTVAEATRAVPVRATATTAPSGFFRKSGKFAVMSKYSAKFASQSAPAFPGERCLRHQVQRKFRAGWKTTKTSACKVEGKQGQVTWKWRGKHPSKVKFRVRATFAGDAVNRPGSAKWLYFRFR